jgi:hypothetical protein
MREIEREGGENTENGLHFYFFLVFLFFYFFYFTKDKVRDKVSL